jgi:hypothetical protein
MKKKIKKKIFAKKSKVPIIVTVLGDNPQEAMKGKLYPPKYKVAMMAEEINMLMYSAKR